MSHYSTLTQLQTPYKHIITGNGQENFKNVLEAITFLINTKMSEILLVTSIHYIYFPPYNASTAVYALFHIQNKNMAKYIDTCFIA